MLDFPRWKIWSIVLILALGVALAIPSLLGETYSRAIGLGGMPRINKGLDLSGGSHLLLEADTSDVIRQRLSLKEEEVRSEIRRANPRISIGDISTQGGKLEFMVRDVAQLDAAVERVRGLTNAVGVTGQRDWNVAVVDGTRVTMTPTQAGITDAVNKAMDTATDVVRRRIDSLGTREPSIVREGNDRIVVQVPGLQDPAALKALLGKTAKLEFKLVDVTANPVDVAAGRAPAGSQLLPYPANPAGPPVIAVQRRAIITGDQLRDARQEFDQTDNQPVVAITFDGNGGRRFARVTQDNVGKPFAIILDNSVISAPNIETAILGGQARISGSFTTESANALAISLRSGSLPVNLKVIEERTVGPQLGADSIRAGIIASTVAALAVIVFMFVTYGRFGLYANIAVTLNIFVILGVMAVMKATLTLPGIAGFVLTIGTAVDANVLINERIREERRRGRNVSHAVELGYKEASRTIFEANVTHAISALIMLLLGIVTSVFTAVTFTRMLVALWIRRNRPTDITI